MTGVSPSVLKTTKIVPVFYKDSKLDYSNCRPTSLKSLCIRDCIPFLIKIMLSITYSLNSDSSILYLMP